MFEWLQNLIQRGCHSIALRSYRWRRRKVIYLGKPQVHWQDPLSLLWYSENTAMRLLKARILDEASRQSQSL